MKVLQYIFVAILLLVILTGCKNNEQTGNIVRFYYCTTESAYGKENGLFAFEDRHILYGVNEHEKLIEEYLNGAKRDECTSPFPGGTTLEDFNLHDGTATIVLSPHMALQSQANVITCCACLCQTLFTLPDIQTISISIDGTQINGENALTFYKDSFIIGDDVSNSITPQS